MPNAAEKSIFFRRAAADIAQLPLIIEKSQQMAAKYWSYQQSGTFASFAVVCRRWQQKKRQKLDSGALQGSGWGWLARIQGRQMGLKLRWWHKAGNAGFG